MSEHPTVDAAHTLSRREALTFIALIATVEFVVGSLVLYASL